MSTRHCLAQTAVCSRTCLSLRCLAAAAEVPTSKLTGSESVYKREGQMPWAKRWWLVQQSWLGLCLTYLITSHLWASTSLTFEQVKIKESRYLQFGVWPGHSLWLSSKETKIHLGLSVKEWDHIEYRRYFSFQTIASQRKNDKEEHYVVSGDLVSLPD